MKILKTLVVILFFILAIGRISLFFSRYPTQTRLGNTSDKNNEYSLIPANNILYLSYEDQGDTIITEIFLPDLDVFQATFFVDTLTWIVRGSYSLIGDQDSQQIVFNPNDGGSAKLPAISIMLVSEGLFSFCNHHQLRISSNEEMIYARKNAIEQKGLLLSLQNKARNSNSCDNIILPLNNENI